MYKNIKTFIITFAIAGTMSASLITTVEQKKDPSSKMANAIVDRDKNQIKQLLEAGENPNGIFGQEAPYHAWGKSPITFAASLTKGKDILDFLIEHGGDIRKTDEYGDSAIRVLENDFKKVQHIITKQPLKRIEYPELDGKSKTDLTRILIDNIRCHTTDLSLIMALLQKGASPNVADHGHTAMILAAKYPLVELITMLVQHGGDLHLRTADDNDPYMELLYQGFENIARGLETLYPRPRTPETRQYAEEINDFERRELLGKNAAEIKFMLSLSDPQNKTH